MQKYSEISNILESAKPLLLRAKTQRRFNKIISDRFKHYNVTCETSIDNEYTHGEVWISGVYDCVTDGIEIHVTKSKSTRVIAITDWKEFKFHLSRVLLHEMIHRQQAQSRNKKVSLDWYEAADIYENIDCQDIDEQREYLKEYDELGAYAHDIAYQIVYEYPKENPYKVLQRITRKRKLSVFDYYRDIFRDSGEWQFVKKELLKRVYKRIPEVVFAIGKI